MRFRSRLFGFLAILFLAWMCYGIYASTSAFQSVTTAEMTAVPGANPETVNAARTAGAGIGAGLGLTFFLCSGGLPFLIFALLSWRNSVGLKRDQQHKEQIAAIQASKQ